MLALRHYDGKDYIEYHHRERIMAVEKPTLQLQDKVKDALSKYYFYLCETKELQCHDQI